MERSSGFLVAAALSLTLGGCTTIGEDESAVELALSAADTTLAVGAIEVVVTDLDSGVETVDSYTAIGGWPTDPAEHTVLLVADTPDDVERRAEVRVTACDSASGCAPLADGVIVLTFVPGEVEEASLLLD